MKLNPQFCPIPSKLNLEQKISIIKQVGAEILIPEEIKGIMSQNKFIYCYDGFEPSGRMHIAQVTIFSTKGSYENGKC